MIAVILAWALPPLWPAAIAIAIAGAALALSLREQTSAGETAYLAEEIVELRKSNTELREDLANTHSMIDELADVVEQIASMSADRVSSASREQLESVRVTLADLETRVGVAEADKGSANRLDTLEARLGAVIAQVNERPTPQPTPEPQSLSLTAAPTAPPENQRRDAGDVRSLMAQANGASVEETAADPEPVRNTRDDHVSLTPIFHPNLGAPVAFVVGSSAPDSADIAPGLLNHAAQIANELESAKKEIRLFVRISPLALSHISVRRDVLAAVDAVPALQRRLTILTPQEGYDETVQNTLSAIADRGCTFALDNVRDWSINLAALSRAGLSHIVVDGIAMAQSAKEQGGDPRRLAEALAAHDIALIAGGVMVREDIDTVRQLDPALVMGDGLGIPRLLEDAS